MFALYLKITLNFLIFDIVPDIKWYYFQYKNEYTRRGKMNQRVEAVDAIRGFALFGILLVNMTLIQFGFFTSENQLIYLAILIKVLIGLFNFSAHITLYPYFLFYLGLALFCYKKYYHKRKKFFPTYIRRIIILLLLGYIHGTFVWEGDILFAYGIIGIF